MIHERSDSSNCQCKSLAWHESALNRTFCPRDMWGGEGRGSYRSCSFDSSTCSLISDLDTNHSRAWGLRCTTVHEQIIKVKKLRTICNSLSTGDQFFWLLATAISNPMGSLLAMGETSVLCQVAVWSAKACRENVNSEVLPFHFLLLLSAWAELAVGF